jgi:hypothetical protein
MADAPCCRDSHRALQGRRARGKGGYSSEVIRVQRMSDSQEKTKAEERNEHRASNSLCGRTLLRHVTVRKAETGLDRWQVASFKNSAAAAPCPWVESYP